MEARQRELPQAVRAKGLVRRKLQHEPLEGVEPVDGRHHAGQRPGRRAVDPADRLARAGPRAAGAGSRAPGAGRSSHRPRARSRGCARSSHLLCCRGEGGTPAWLGHPGRRRARHRRGALARRGGGRPCRLVVRPDGSIPVPGGRLHLRRRVHDRGASRARVAGAGRPEPPLARATGEGGRTQPPGRLVCVLLTARARRTTHGKPQEDQCTASREDNRRLADDGRHVTFFRA